MSVGHLARMLEEAGIATVVIASSVFRSRMLGMKLARLVLTPHPMGRVLGAPGDKARQLEVVHAALELLAHAKEPEVVCVSGNYRGGQGSITK